jgi:hypothetical protein
MWADCPKHTTIAFVVASDNGERIVLPVRIKAAVGQLGLREVQI